MNILKLLTFLGLSFAVTSQLEAATTDVVQSKSKSSQPHSKKVKRGRADTSKGLLGPKGELKTDMNFDGSTLHGIYQTPEEALIKVENEKGLSDLIGVRKHFKDRLSVAAEQE